jgi:hypothetical protein
MTESDITIENIALSDALKFAEWLDHYVLGVRLPQPGPNTAASTVMPAIRQLLAVIPNRQSYATELYAIVAATLANYKRDNKTDKGKAFTAATDDNVARVTCIQDLLYRAIQQLQTQYDAASRMITVIDSETHIGGHS